MAEQDGLLSSMINNILTKKSDALYDDGLIINLPFKAYIADCLKNHILFQIIVIDNYNINTIPNPLNMIDNLPEKIYDHFKDDELKEAMKYVNNDSIIRIKPIIAYPEIHIDFKLILKDSKYVSTQYVYYPRKSDITNILEKITIVDNVYIFLRAIHNFYKIDRS